MDPVTQGAFGAVFTQLNRARFNGSRAHDTRKVLVRPACIGALAGMAPDLDVLIRSSADPLLALEFHRHFTHSIFFIPFGGLICAGVFFLAFAKRWGLSFFQVWLWSCIGYATHGVLDGCTSYGTQLLWPFSDKRFAWDVISVVDPLVTIPLTACVFLAAKKGRQFAWLGVMWIAVYFSLAEYQHRRALQIGHDIASSRVGVYQNLQAKPSFANIVVWKVIYETEESYFVDAVRPGFANHRVWPGDSILKFNLERDLPWLNPESQQAKDVERFRWFSNGFIAVDPRRPDWVVDVRYSMLPHRVDPLWGIKLSPSAKPGEHAQFASLRERPEEAWKILWAMIVNSKQ